VYVLIGPGLCPATGKGLFEYNEWYPGLPRLRRKINRRIPLLTATARLHRVVKKQVHKKLLILSIPENVWFYEPQLQIL
jgi:hypothetical protein